MSHFIINNKPPSRPRRFNEMAAQEKLDWLELFEARNADVCDLQKKDNNLRRYIRVMEETDPEFKLLMDFGRRAYPQLFYPGRLTAPSEVEREFRRLHDRQRERGRNIPGKDGS